MKPSPAGVRLAFRLAYCRITKTTERTARKARSGVRLGDNVGRNPFWISATENPRIRPIANPRGPVSLYHFTPLKRFFFFLPNRLGSQPRTCLSSLLESNGRYAKKETPSKSKDRGFTSQVSPMDFPCDLGRASTRHGDNSGSRILSVWNTQSPFSIHQSTRLSSDSFVSGN